jgi:hypothetical protein
LTSLKKLAETAKTSPDDKKLLTDWETKLKTADAVYGVVAEKDMPSPPTAK